jgi:hypothetical protein
MTPRILFRPAFHPGLVPADRGEPGFAGLVASWRDATRPVPALVPAASPFARPVDYEDWVENAVQLVAALESGLPVWTADPGGGRAPVTPVRLNRAGDTAFDPDAPTIVVGALLKGADDDSLPWSSGEKGGTVLWPDTNQFPLANRYWALESFRRHAGRHHEIVDCTMPALKAALRGMAERGIAEAFLKATKAKHGVYRLDVPAAAAPDTPAFDAAAGKALRDALEYDLAYLEGMPTIVQEAVAMSFEYRIVVVDGRPVAGAGITQAATPLLNGGQAFDDRMTRRPDGDAAVRDRDKVAEYLTFAARVLGDLRREVPDLTHFTLDLATLDATGSPIVVEINPLANFGLYACDYRRILAAIVASVADGTKSEEAPPLRASPARDSSLASPRGRNKESV